MPGAGAEDDRTQHGEAGCGGAPAWLARQKRGVRGQDDRLSRGQVMAAPDDGHEIGVGRMRRPDFDIRRRLPPARHVLDRPRVDRVEDVAGSAVCATCHSIGRVDKFGEIASQVSQLSAMCISGPRKAVLVQMESVEG